MLHPFRPEQLSADVQPSEADVQEILFSSAACRRA
jgi:hypothetical protein